MFVLKYPIQHQELLTAAMHMRREVAVWSVADDRSGARDLVAHAVQHAPMNTGHRGGNPVERGCVDARPAAEVRVEMHRHPPINWPFFRQRADCSTLLAVSNSAWSKMA